MNSIASSVVGFRCRLWGMLLVLCSFPSLSAQQTVADSILISDKDISFPPLLLKTNLLYDAILMSDIEVEYRFDNHWSAAVETSMAWWHCDRKHWYYQLATVMPDVRYRIPARKPGHCHSIGIFGSFSWYDLENGGRGYKGEAWTAGVGYTYSFPVNKLLGFEAGIGVGYLRSTYEEYLPIEGHYVYQQTGRTSFWGPLRLKFALVFDLDRYVRKGGRP